MKQNQPFKTSHKIDHSEWKSSPHKDTNRYQWRLILFSLCSSTLGLGPVGCGTNLWAHTYKHTLNHKNMHDFWCEKSSWYCPWEAETQENKKHKETFLSWYFVKKWVFAPKMRTWWKRRKTRGDFVLFCFLFFVFMFFFFFFFFAQALLIVMFSFFSVSCKFVHSKTLIGTSG